MLGWGFFGGFGAVVAAFPAGGELALKDLAAVGAFPVGLGMGDGGTALFEFVDDWLSGGHIGLVHPYRGEGRLRIGDVAARAFQSGAENDCGDAFLGEKSANVLGFDAVASAVDLDHGGSFDDDRCP